MLKETGHWTRKGGAMHLDGKQVRIDGRMVRVARLAAEGIEFWTDLARIGHRARAEGLKADILTFLQKLPDLTPRYAYRLEWDNVAALRVSTYEEWWSKQVVPTVRNKVRKAERTGVVVRELPFDETLVRGISAIYDEAPVRQGKPFWHYRKTLERVRQENQTFCERSVFLGASSGDRLIGFAKLVVDEDNSQANVMQILSLLSERDKAPTNALIAAAVRCCAERQVPYFVYSNFAYGRKQRDGLSDFKRDNGFVRLELPRYYVPLTIVGRIALRLDLHRSLMDHVPGQVLARARQIRARWYGARPLAAGETG